LRQAKIETAVFSEQLQHVIEEANAGGDVIPAASFDTQFAGDLSLFGVALNLSGSGHGFYPASTFREN